MRKVFLCVMVAAILILNGCTKGTGNIDKPQVVKQAAKPAQSIIVTDFAQRTVSLQKVPEKIVSLSPAVTEILCSMGYGDKIIAVSEETTYPNEVVKKTKVGKYADIDIDAIEKLTPDIVFASKYTYKSIADSLENMKMPVVYAEAENYNGIFDSIAMVGKILKDQEKASELSTAIKKEVEKMQESESEERPNVLYIQSLSPLYAAGSDTLINDEIWLAGGSNAAQDIKGYQEADKLSLLTKKVDIIILSDKLAGQGIDLGYLQKVDGFKDLDAVENGKVYAISNGEKMETSGVRIVDAIKEMKGVLEKSGVRNQKSE